MKPQDDSETELLVDNSLPQVHHVQHDPILEKGPQGMMEENET